MIPHDLLLKLVEVDPEHVYRDEGGIYFDPGGCYLSEASGLFAACWWMSCQFEARFLDFPQSGFSCLYPIPPSKNPLMSALIFAATDWCPTREEAVIRAYIAWKESQKEEQQ